MQIFFRLVLWVLVLAALPAQAEVGRAPFLELAKKGWVYELRTARWARDADAPPARINGRDLAGSALCLVGESPHPQTLLVLDSFRALMHEVFGKPLPMRVAGDDLSACGTGRTVYLRLYSGDRPQRAFDDDLRIMDRAFGLGLGGHWPQIVSPGQAQTFFGTRGQPTHLLVKQPGRPSPSQLERRFFASILIEELYQSFTFGMDVPHFDRRVAFVSKLEEYPVNLRHLQWDSAAFMTGLLRSNPGRLCRFDVFMLHALARAPVEQTNSSEFLHFIDARYDDLMRRTEKTVSRAAYSPILNTTCDTD